MRGKLRLTAAALALCLLLSGCGRQQAEGSSAPSPTSLSPPSPTPTSTAEVSLPPVYSDWSQLTPYDPPQVKYTRRYEEFTDHLIPSEDYGAILPFAGASLARQESWSGYRESYDLYGLVTLEGEVVVDPVFTSAFALVERDSSFQTVSTPKVWLLSKTFPSPNGGEPRQWSALCAMDGSWCTDFLYEYDWETMMTASFDGGIPLLRKGGGIAFVDPESGQELQWVGSQWDTEAGYWNNICRDPETGWISANHYDWEAGVTTPLLFDPQGNRVSLPHEVEWVGQYGDGLVPAMIRKDNVASRYGYLDARTGQWAIPPSFSRIDAFVQGLAPVDDGTNAYLIDPSGTPLTEGYPRHFQRHGDFWYFQNDTYSVAAVFDLSGQPVDSPLTAVNGSVSFEADGWVSVDTGTERLLVRGKEVHSFPLELGWLSHLQEDKLLFFQSEPDRQATTLLDLEGNILVRWEGGSSTYFTRDELTGESYVSFYPYSVSEGRSFFYHLDGTLAFSCSGSVYPKGGLLYRWEDGYSSLMDRTGTLIFGWSYPLAED